MKSFRATTMIQASPAAVWQVLTDGSSWTAWDSGVTAVQGRIAPGERLTVSVAANPGRAFPVTVVQFDQPRRMVWSGGMPLGLFKGVRTYTLSPTGNGTEFTMEEVYSGLVAPLITRSIPDLSGSFEQFANGLRKRVEQGA